MPNVGQPGLEELDWIAEAAQRPGTQNYDRFCDWFDHQKDLRAMEEEARKVTSIRTKLGWSKGKMFKRIASFPLHVFAIMRYVDKDFARNNEEGRKRLYRFLARNRLFRAD